jgi:hypothetical protein
MTLLRMAPAGTPPPTAGPWALPGEPGPLDMSGWTEMGYIDKSAGVQLVSGGFNDSGSITPVDEVSFRTDLNGSWSGSFTIYDADWRRVRTWSNAFLPWEPPRPQLHPHTTFRLHDPCAWAQPDFLDAMRRIRNTPFAELFRNAFLTDTPRRFL